MMKSSSSLPEAAKDSSESSPEVEEHETNWPGFANASSCVVQARFNITEIEVDNAEDTDQSFLQRLIEEGIPVKVLSESPIVDQSSIGIIVPPTLDQPNLGIIVPSPNLDNRQSNNITTTSEPDLHSMSSNNESGDNSEALVNNIESFVEVTGLSKPISNNFFLHLVPSDTNVEEIVLADDMEAVLRRTSTNASLIKGSEDDSQPVKKKVRFDLPNRKASLVGEYVILRQPLIHDKHRKKNRRKTPNSRVDDFDGEKEGDGNRGRKSRIEFAADKEEIETFIPYETEIEEEEDSVEESLDIQECPDERSLKGRCGCRSWTPQWLQSFLRIDTYFVVFCVVAIFQGMLFTYNMSVITTIQKRFNVTSKQAGYILSGNDITQIIITIFVAYYGSTCHRPRWMGYGALSSALSALLAASPHFIYGSGDPSNMFKNPNTSLFSAVWHPSVNRRLELCGVTFPENCPTRGQGRGTEYSYVVFALFCSQMLIGVSTAIYWTVGVSFLVDHINGKKISFYLAIFTSLRVAGPTCGFLLGTSFLSYWVDPLVEVNIQQKDPNWIGAWWLGFVVLSVSIALPGLLYFTFPKKLSPPLKKNLITKRIPIAANGRCKRFASPRNLSPCRHRRNSSFDKEEAEEEEKSFKDLFRSLKRLFTNKIWTANLISNTTFVLAMSGYWNFKPKYMQSQFRTRASAANYYTGVTTMLASIGGVAMSGIILRWVRPSVRLVTAYNVCLSIYAVLSLLIMMSIHCSAPVLAGHLPGQEPWACSSHCQCTELFSPICAEDGVTTFFSPCYAGCASVNTSASPVEYSDCSCFGSRKNEVRKFSTEDSSRGNIKGIPSTSDEGYAVSGFCPTKCNAVSYYLFIQMVTKVVFASGRVAGMLVNISSVKRKDITLALGTVAACVTCVGFLPASYLMGSAIDGACLVWDRQCGKRGNCSFYDNDKLRIVMHLIPAAVLVISGIGDAIVYMNHSKLDLYKENEASDDEMVPDEPLSDRERTRLNCARQKLRRYQSSPS